MASPFTMAHQARHHHHFQQSPLSMPVSRAHTGPIDSEADGGESTPVERTRTMPESAREKPQAMTPRTAASKSFIPKSPAAPKDIFVRDALFNQCASRVTSYTMNAEEMRKLSKTLGYMPKIIQWNTGAPTSAAVQTRVSELDDALRERVQKICEKVNNRANGEDHWCTSRMRSSCELVASCFRLGVIWEIWPEISFYLLYTLGLQYYASLYDWDFRWSAVTQDTVYYPALVLSFLLSFRASACMDRYSSGRQRIFVMERSLRDLAYDVMTRLDDTTKEGDTGQMEKSLKCRYFKHELKRLCLLLFVCAGRDLNDSALEDGSIEPQALEASASCAMTSVEQAAIHVTHSSQGHVFRVYLVSSWLQKLISDAEDAELFSTTGIAHRVSMQLSEFKHAWIEARNIAYSEMPNSIIHLLWILVNILNFVLPWEYVTVTQRFTWLPSLFVSVSFFGIVQIANNMENPFGFDDDDIPVAEVAEQLDEEMSLIMFYAALDEVGGENTYRGLAAQDHIYVV